MLNQERIKGLSHIAIVVPSLEGLDKWLALFNQETEKYFSEEQGVKALVIKTGEFDIEFLEPIDDKSSVNTFLTKNPKGGIHHICFFVDNLQDTLLSIKDIGIRSITRKEIKGLIHNTPVAFLNPKDLSNILIEFEELPKGS